MPQRRAVISLTLILALGLPAAALANSAGIINQYGPAATCFNCHLPGQWMQGTINLTSPAYAGLKYTFSFTCTAPASGGVLPVAGVNVHATCGKLSLHPAETKTKLVSGQITHSQPKAASGGSVTYKFNWTAPASSTGCAVNVTGLLGNNNKLSSGDVTCQAMKGLLVLPVPDGGVPPQKDAGVTPKQDTGTTPKKDSGHHAEQGQRRHAEQGQRRHGQRRRAVQHRRRHSGRRGGNRRPWRGAAPRAGGGRRVRLHAGGAPARGGRALDPGAGAAAPDPTPALGGEVQVAAAC